VKGSAQLRVSTVKPRCPGVDLEYVKPHPAVRHLALIGLVALVCFAVARLSREYLVEPSVGIAVVWPLSGLLLGLLLVAPRSAWPSVLAGAVIGGFPAFLDSGVAADASAGLALVNGAESLLAASVVRSLGGSPDALRTLRGTLALVVGAVIAANAVTTPLGGALAASAFGSSFSSSSAVWFAAHGVGMLALAPAVVAVSGLRARALGVPKPRRAFESALILGGMALTASIVFFRHDADVPLLDFPFLIFPFVIGAAVRLSWSEAVTAVLMLATIAAVASVNGEGPFAASAGTAAESVVEGQVFVVAVGSATLMAAALTAERIAAIARLQDEYRFAQGMVEHVADGVTAVSASGQMIAINREARRIFGQGITDQPTDRWTEVYAIQDPETREPIAQGETPLLRGLRGETTRDRLLRVAPKGELPRLVKSSAEPIRDEAGNIIGAVASIRDETRRLEVERERELERSQLAEAQRIARVGSSVMDPQTGRVTWSPQQYRNWGLEPQAGPFPATLYMDMIHPEDRERIRATLSSLTDSPHDFQVEFRVIRPDGRTATLEVRGRRVEGPDGRPLVASTSRDVTTERDAQRALREAEERFRRAFEDSATGMALVDVADLETPRFEDVNAALAELTDYSRDRLVGMICWSLVHPDDAGTLREGLAHVVAGELPSIQREIRITGQGGGSRWVAIGVSVVRDGAGHPVNAVLQAIDLTERKRVEGQLQHLADHDPLTGLLNRRRFESELEREVDRVRRYGGDAAVLIVDLDEFKAVNDTYGHAAGDELLIAISDSLRATLRSSDLLARLGGDEFGVVLPATSLTEATALGERIRAAVAAAAADAPGGGVTVCVGASAVSGRRGAITPDELVIEADVAMYEAKQSGRDRVLAHGRG
jgi:diguanylate cyclase (GGDEF)-like protein/PAS domain S-box-containing protein